MYLFGSLKESPQEMLKKVRLYVPYTQYITKDKNYSKRETRGRPKKKDSELWHSSGTQLTVWDFRTAVLFFYGPFRAELLDFERKLESLSIKHNDKANNDTERTRFAIEAFTDTFETRWQVTTYTHDTSPYTPLYYFDLNADTKGCKLIYNSSEFASNVTKNTNCGLRRNDNLNRTIVASKIPNYPCNLITGIESKFFLPEVPKINLSIDINLDTTETLKFIERVLTEYKTVFRSTWQDVSASYISPFNDHSINDLEFAFHKLVLEETTASWLELNTNKAWSDPKSECGRLDGYLQTLKKKYLSPQP